MTATLNLATAPGHQVLAAAGKKILRPGGRKATEQLFTWANRANNKQQGANYGDRNI